MCDPLTIAGAALTLGSTFLSSRAAKQQADARNKASQAELARQEGFKKQAADAFNASVGQFSRGAQDKQIQVIQDERNQGFQDVLDNADFGVSDLPLSESAPKIVGSSAATQLSDTLAKGRERARALANLGAFSESNFLNNIALGRTDQDLARFGSFSAGSQNLLPGELDVANRQGSGLAAGADILGALGTVASTAGAFGYNPFSSAATGTSALPDVLRSVPPVPAPKPPTPSSFFALR